MKKFLVSAVGKEFLAAKVIEAATEDEAEQQYWNMWEAGLVEVASYETQNVEVRETMDGKGESDEV